MIESAPKGCAFRVYPIDEVRPLDEASEAAHVSSLRPLFGGLRVVGAHRRVLAAVFCDGDEYFVVEVDVAPAAKDKVVDDRRVELEIDVLAVENAGVVGQRLLRDALDERVAHVAEPGEQLVRVLDVAAVEELDGGQRLLVDRPIAMRRASSGSQ